MSYLAQRGVHNAKHGLAMTVQLELVEGGGIGEQLAGGSEFLDEIGNAIVTGNPAAENVA